MAEVIQDLHNSGNARVLAAEGERDHALSNAEICNINPEAVSGRQLSTNPNFERIC